MKEATSVLTLSGWHGWETEWFEVRHPHREAGPSIWVLEHLPAAVCSPCSMSPAIKWGNRRPGLYKRVSWWCYSALLRDESRWRPRQRSPTTGGVGRLISYIICRVPIAPMGKRIPSLTSRGVRHLLGLNGTFTELGLRLSQKKILHRMRKSQEVSLPFSAQYHGLASITLKQGHYIWRYIKQSWFYID